MVSRFAKRCIDGSRHTPLKVRNTVSRLRECSQGARHIRRLLWPFPWHFRPQQPPADIVNVGSNDKIVHVLHPDIRQLQCMPLFRARDTPLCSLYRMFEDLCTRQDVWMGYECQYFFYHSEPRWRLSQIPDPRAKDPAIAAGLASLVDAMVTAFNWKLELGIRRTGRNDSTDDRVRNFEPEIAPAWVAEVPALEKLLDLHTNPHRKEGEPHPAFLERNIKACVGRIYDV